MITSEITEIAVGIDCSADYIEKALKKKFNNIIHWAVISANSDVLKISVTFELFD